MIIDNQKKETDTSNANACEVSNRSGHSLYAVNLWNSAGRLIRSAFENTLTLLHSSEGDTIPDGKDAKVSLSGNPAPKYSLLFLNEKNLCPEKGILIDPSQEKNPKVEVTQEDTEASKLAINFFCRSSSSFFTSELSTSLTQNLQQFLSYRRKAIVDQWFQRSELYQKLNPLKNWNSFSYVETLPAVYLRETNQTSFYLYSPSVSSDVVSIKPPIFRGTLEVKQVAPKAFEGPQRYKIEWINTESKPASLTYKEGTFVGEDICILSGFIDRSNLTCSEKDKEIIPFLYGKIQGISLFGVQKEQDLSKKKPGKESWYALWHPKNFSLWIDLCVKLAATELAHLCLLRKTEGIYRYQANQLFPSSISPPSTIYEALRQSEEELKPILKKAKETHQKIGGRAVDFPSQDEIAKNQILLRESIASQIAFQQVISQHECFIKKDLSIREVESILGASPTSLGLHSQLKKQRGSSLKALEEYANDPSSVSGSSLRRMKEENIGFIKSFDVAYQDYIQNSFDRIGEEAKRQIAKNRQEEQSIQKSISYLDRVSSKQLAGKAPERDVPDFWI